MKIETDKANPDHSLILGDITAGVIMTHIEASVDCNTETDAPTTGAVHDGLTQPTEDTATDLTLILHTSHITDHPNIKAPQFINLKITVDHIHDHPINLQDMNLTNQIPISAGQEEEHESED